MNVKFQVWPYFQQVFFARYFQHLLGQYNSPGRYPGNIGYIFLNGCLGHSFHLLLIVVHQGNRNIRCAVIFRPYRQVFDQYCRKVAIKRILVQLVDLVPAPKYKAFSGQDLVIGAVVAKNGKHVFASFKVAFLQRLFRYGDKFAPVACCTR
ncbi:hypothetical protein D3C87_1606880 [compost metagenome]